MLAYIPSPSTNGISIGPLRLHMYGFLIVAGVFAAVWLSDRRWRAGGGEAGTFSAIAVWAVPGGLIGARLYHVATDYELYTHHPIGAFEIWNGGLGIWGGIAGGVLAGWLYIRRHNLDFLAILDIVAPALPLAQAIGRWGNYFNQELFGRPTTLPWGLRIDVANRPAPYANFATFQPTFLYESLWDLTVVFLVLWIEKRVGLRKGFLFWVYVALYTFGRFFTEYLRIDFAHRVLGLRINDWVSVIIFVVAATLVLKKGLVRRSPPAVGAGEEDDDSVDDPALEPSQVAVVADSRSGGTTSTGGTGFDEEGLIGPVTPADAGEVTPEGPPPKSDPTATQGSPAAAPPGHAPTVPAARSDPTSAPQTVPATAERITAGPATAEPTTGDPAPTAQVTAAQLQPATAEPATADAPTADAATADAATADAPTAESTTTEPTAEPEQAEPEQAEPEQAEPEQAEPEQAEPEQAEPEHAEPEQTEAEQPEREPAADHGDHGDGGANDTQGG